MLSFLYENLTAPFVLLYNLMRDVTPKVVAYFSPQSFTESHRVLYYSSRITQIISLFFTTWLIIKSVESVVKKHRFTKREASFCALLNVVFPFSCYKDTTSCKFIVRQLTLSVCKYDSYQLYLYINQSLDKINSNHFPSWLIPCT